MSSSNNHRSEPCRFYSRGRCRLGDRCKFGHGGDAQSNAEHLHSSQPDTSSIQLTGCIDHTERSRQRRRQHPASSSSDPASSPYPLVSDTRARPRLREVPCRAWKAGTCTKGSGCWFRHDVDVPKSGLEPLGSNEQSPSALLPPVSFLAQEDSSTSAAACLPRVECSLVEVVQISAPEAEAAAHERANVIFKEEAAKTISQLVFGSIVTFSAGLDVPNLITGFETCTLHVGNLPLDVKEEDVRDLVKSHCSDVNYFHVVIKKRSDRGPEVHIITDIAAGQVIALGLYGVESQEETLVIEMSATNSFEGMNAATGQSSEILTISWHVPSKRYVAEYADIDAANAKVKELDRLVYGGRRIKVEMNSHPRGRLVPNLRLNAIKINNLPPSVTDEDVRGFTGSTAVKQLPIGGVFGFMYPVEHIARLVREDIERVVPGGLRQFDDPPSTCIVEGVVSARAHFSSWDEARIAYTGLLDRRYGNQPVWLRLPDPMYFTLIIPVDQYKAQKAQWNELLGSIKDRNACTLNVRECRKVVHIRLSGSVKEATGALKVRVENLARGVKVEGWHRSLGIPRNQFVSHVHSETGAYLRADRKQKSLKVYGTPTAVDHAREMIRRELDRLASLDYTITLAQRSVGFFVREGIQLLKETLGENNVKFIMASRKVTVSGGEEARHALDRLITLSHKDDGCVPKSNAPQGSRTCPICYDSVSSPHLLGCGHAYCIACFRHFISSALDSDQLPLTCLGDEAQCRVPIPIPTIQQYLPPASFNRLLEVAFDAYIAKHPEEFKHCKTPDCTQIYRAAQAGVAPQTLHCPSCFSAVCNGCHEDGHDGISCAEIRVRRDPAEQERMTDAWIASQGGRVKKCPQCGVPIEKLEGCNHMTCQCGAHICWRCTGVFTVQTIYEHMHTAHGTIYDDDQPADPEPPIDVGDIGIPIDIEEQRELYREVEMRRFGAFEDAEESDTDEADVAWYHDPDDLGAADFDVVHRAIERQEEEERFTRLQWQRAMEEQERALDRLRLLEAVEEQERRQHQEIEEQERLFRIEQWLRNTEEQERVPGEERQHQEIEEQGRLVRIEQWLRDTEEQEGGPGEERPGQEIEEQERQLREIEEQERCLLREEEWEKRLREQHRESEERRMQEERHGGGCGCAIM